jgi:hypothetical protein
MRNALLILWSVIAGIGGLALYMVGLDALIVMIWPVIFGIWISFRIPKIAAELYAANDDAPPTERSE